MPAPVAGIHVFLPRLRKQAVDSRDKPGHDHREVVVRYKSRDYSIIFPIFTATAMGVRQIDPVLVRAAETLGASKHDIFRYVELPAAGPMVPFPPRPSCLAAR